MVLLADRRHGLGKDAINTKLDAHRVIASFDMNIAGPPLQSGKNSGIDQANNWTDIALCSEPVDGDAVLTADLVFMNHIKREAFAGFLEHALGLFRLLEDFADLRQCGNFGDNTLAQKKADLINHHQLAGIGDGDSQASILGFVQRDEVIAKHQIYWYFLKKIVVQLEIVQVHKLAAVAARYILGLLLIVDVGRRRQTPAIPAGRDYCGFVFRHSYHSESSCASLLCFPQ